MNAFFMVTVAVGLMVAAWGVYSTVSAGRTFDSSAAVVAGVVLVLQGSHHLRRMRRDRLPMAE